MATLNGIPLKAGLEVEIYSITHEKWSLGKIKRIQYVESYRSNLYQVIYDDNGWSKVILEREVHLMLRLPKKKNKSDGQDEEKKLQDFSQQISDKLPLKKETVYESLRTLLKEARNIDIHENVTWRGVLEAVDHELYPKIATAMAMSVEELLEDGILGMTEFEPHVIDEVVRVLKLNKNDLLNKEVDYSESQCSLAG